MALRFIEETHQYFDGDIELPSVTQIIRFCNYDKKSASGNDPFYRDRGTAIHELCTDIDLTGETPQGTGYDGYLTAYATFLRDYRMKAWEYIERPLGSAAIGFAGTIDRIGLIDGRPAILDIKTGSTINTVALAAQLTGYENLGRGMGFYTEALYGLQLKKDGKYRLIRVERDPALFESCMTIHRRFEKKEKKHE